MKKYYVAAKKGEKVETFAAWTDMPEEEFIEHLDEKGFYQIGLCYDPHIAIDWTGHDWKRFFVDSQGKGLFFEREWYNTETYFAKGLGEMLTNVNALRTKAQKLKTEASQAESEANSTLKAVAECLAMEGRDGKFCIPIYGKMAVINFDYGDDVADVEFINIVNLQG